MGGRYHNPFPGKPAPLPMSGIFLFGPEVDLKLGGLTMRTLFIEEGRESLFKRIERTVKLKQEPTPALMHDLLGWLPDCRTRDEFAAAFDGNVDARRRLDGIGPWEFFAAGMYENPPRAKPYWIKFFVELERACLGASRMLCDGRVTEAAAAVSHHELLGRLLWPDALSIWANRTEMQRLLPLRASIAVEVRLSQLAAMDVGLNRTSPLGRDVTSLFMTLLPEPENPSRTPTRQLFRWLMEAAGAKSMTKLLADPRLASVDGLDLSTMKRWSSGACHPDRSLLQRVAESLFGGADYEPIQLLDMGARYLNLMGYLAQTLTERARRLSDAGEAPVLAPWPLLPFGYESFESWCQARYPVWLAFHQQHFELKEIDETAEAVS